MRILRQAAELSDEDCKASVAIGFFDGVHLGHQQILRQTISDARQFEADSVVVTFDTHPSQILAPSRAPKLIYSLEQRLSVIESLGVDALLLIHFDEAFSQKTGEQFVRELVAGFGQVCSVCVGGDFTFGCQRSGDVDLLKSLGTEQGFSVHGLASVALDGQTVSSTRIRTAIQGGELDAASQMLGRPYSLWGKIVKGNQLGRQLGFPTANIEIAGRVVPPNGVYAAHVNTEGIERRAVANVGYRPTLGETTPRLHVEAHLFEFDGDLYGKSLELTFHHKLRDEKKFDSIEELKSQIQRDADAARLFFD